MMSSYPLSFSLYFSLLLISLSLSSIDLLKTKMKKTTTKQNINLMVQVVINLKIKK